MPRSFAAPRLALALLPLALTVGCYANEEDDPGLHEFRTTFACSSCGFGSSNSPAINDFGVPELHLAGEANSAGVSLLGIIDLNSQVHTLQVIKEEFVVVIGEYSLSGSDLIGWKILLDTPEGAIEVEISSYGQASSLATVGKAISTYGLKYESKINENETVSVCPGELKDDPVITLIRGETYDRDLKLVQPGQDKWVTLACAQEAVFKMKRMNYGPNAQFNNTLLPATVNQRQATLKMITADYCGGGISYTVQGTPLIWQDTAHTVGPETVQTPNQREAFWDENGAICLDTPRFVAKSEVDIECHIPSCSGINPAASIWRTITP